VVVAIICGEPENASTIPPAEATATSKAEHLPPTPQEAGQIVPTSSPSPGLSSTKLVLVDDQLEQETLEKLPDTPTPAPIKLLANGYEKHAELPFEERLERIRDIGVAQFIEGRQHYGEVTASLVRW